MSVFIITCPKTGKQVSTGVEAIQPLLNHGIASKTATMRCPVCGQKHMWTPSGARVGEDRQTYKTA